MLLDDNNLHDGMMAKLPLALSYFEMVTVDSEEVLGTLIASAFLFC